MRIRIVRSIQVKANELLNALQLSLRTADHVEAQVKIRPGVFWVRYGPQQSPEVKIFMDFDSFAHYEQDFLESLPYDTVYMNFVQKMADFVTQEPRDEVLILMEKDYFFGSKSRKKRSAVNPARKSAPQRRYRLVRHLDVKRGKLRDFLTATYDFMDKFELATQVRPELYSTRFGVERVGSSKIFFDYDDCPLCEPILMRHSQLLMQDTRDLLASPPSDQLYAQVSHKDFTLDLESAARTIPRKTSKKQGAKPRSAKPRGAMP